MSDRLSDHGLLRDMPTVRHRYERDATGRMVLAETFPVPAPERLPSYRCRCGQWSMAMTLGVAGIRNQLAKAVALTAYEVEVRRAWEAHVRDRVPAHRRWGRAIGRDYQT